MVWRHKRCGEIYSRARLHRSSVKILPPLAIVQAPVVCVHKHEIISDLPAVDKHVITAAGTFVSRKAILTEPVIQFFFSIGGLLRNALSSSLSGSGEPGH